VDDHEKSTLITSGWRDAWWARLARRGLGGDRLVTLDVVGRRSGTMIAVPLNDRVRLVEIPPARRVPLVRVEVLEPAGTSPR
jgi:hypothetical protein